MNNFLISKMMITLNLLRLFNITLLTIYDVVTIYMKMWNKQTAKEVLAPAVDMTYATMISRAKKSAKELRIPSGDTMLHESGPLLALEYLTDIRPDSYEAKRAFLELNNARVMEQEATVDQVLLQKRMQVSSRFRNALALLTTCTNILFKHNFLKMLMLIIMVGLALGIEEDTLYNVLNIIVDNSIICKLTNIAHIASNYMTNQEEINKVYATQVILSIARIIVNTLTIFFL